MNQHHDHDEHGHDEYEHEHDGHDHDGHGSDDARALSVRRERRLMTALVLNSVIVTAQVIFGIVAKSVGLIADAGHNLTDVAAIIASLIAVRWARKAANARHSFGFHRTTILAALANAVTILAVTVFITYEAIQRLINPEPVSGGIVLVVAVIAAAANLAAVFAVRESHAGHGHGSDLNMRSAMLHLIGDTAASVGVAIAGAVILISGGAYWLDPIVSLAIGVLISYHAWKLLREATDVLLEATPDSINIDEVTEAIAAMDGIEQVHDLHVWSLSSDVRALSAHLVLEGHPTLEEAQAVAATVKQSITPRFSIAHATFELECETCAPAGDWCPIDDITVETTTTHTH